MEKLVTIEGMHCMHCAGAVKKAIEALGGQAEVSLENKTALVTAENEISDEALRTAIDKKGFEVVTITKK